MCLLFWVAFTVLLLFVVVVVFFFSDAVVFVIFMSLFSLFLCLECFVIFSGVGCMMRFWNSLCCLFIIIIFF